MRATISIFVSLMVVIGWCHSSLAADYGFGGDITVTVGIQVPDSSYVVDTATSPANSGTLDSAIVFLSANVAGPHQINVVIYNADSTFLDSTTDITVSEGAFDWYSANFVEGASISASTMYFVGIHGASEGGVDGNFKYGYLSGGTSVSAWYKYSDQPTIPPTITAPTKDAASKEKGFWVYYSDAAEPSAAKKLGAGKYGKIK